MYNLLSARYSVPIHGMRVFDDYEEKVRRIRDEAINLVPQGLFRGVSGNYKLPESTSVMLELDDTPDGASRIQDLEGRIGKIKGVSNVSSYTFPEKELGTPINEELQHSA